MNAWTSVLMATGKQLSDWVQLLLDVGVDPKKSTGVDLGTSSRVESVTFGAVDPPSNVKLQSDFTPSRPQIYFFRTF